MGSIMSGDPGRDNRNNCKDLKHIFFVRDEELGVIERAGGGNPVLTLMLRAFGLKCF